MCGGPFSATPVMSVYDLDACLEARSSFIGGRNSPLDIAAPSRRLESRVTGGTRRCGVSCPDSGCMGKATCAILRVPFGQAS